MLDKCGLAAQINIEQGIARSTYSRSFSCLPNLAAGLSKKKLSQKKFWKPEKHPLLILAASCKPRCRPNENKISDGYRERAPIKVDVF